MLFGYYFSCTVPYYDINFKFKGITWHNVKFIYGVIAMKVQYVNGMQLEAECVAKAGVCFL